jgi:UDP-N-acetylmuramoyl-L-alanyl-D-glutamate--2,6-diaminopimelate ligase
MLISKLLPEAKRTGPDVNVEGLSRDSRTVKKDFLFAAISGDKTDGRTFIEDAVKKGAGVLLVSQGTQVPENITAVFVDEPRRALAMAASRYYSGQPQTVTAITGTSGKTSTVQFTRQLWQLGGKRAASIGTLGLIGNDIERYGSLTTPDCISLHQDLQMLASEKRITHVAMEASSHGLDQFRLDGVKISIAAFTNLSRDHLDYHLTMEAYFAAKMRLFTEILADGGTAIVNADIKEFPAIREAVAKRKLQLLSFGSAASDLQLLEKNYLSGGQDMKLAYNGKTYSTRINLVGAFQSANVMCATGIALASGEDAEKLMTLLPKLQGVRGRLERIGDYQGGAVYVDYAHKPDAMENVLQALRPHTEKRLITVFGCGGNRDAGKRPIMGEIAARLSDIVIVTDDNPRHEDPATIRKEVMQGCPGATQIGDRAEAISHALSLMQSGDVVVIAGKGHEPGQIIGDETRPFDDAEVARIAMQEKAA